jgi:hypothetical protein
MTTAILQSISLCGDHDTMLQGVTFLYQLDSLVDVGGRA